MKQYTQLLVLLIYPIVSWGNESCQLPGVVKPWNYHATQAIKSGRDWKNEKIPTDSWILSLSWSVSFCDRLRNKRVSMSQRHQCQHNSFGLIVHGLWAQSLKAQGDYSRHPRNCRDAKAISEKTLSNYLCIIPGVQLMQMQWEKHGTCDFATPEAYLAKTAQLYHELKLPSTQQLKQLERKRASVIRKAFVDLNRQSGLTEKHVWVHMQRGKLSEIRICYDLNYQYSHCKIRQSS